MVEKAKSFCVDAVNAASGGVTFDAPEGKVTVNGDNHHIAKTGLIGQINADNQFDIVWSSEKPIEPDPFLKGYAWWDPNAGLTSWLTPTLPVGTPRPGGRAQRTAPPADVTAPRTRTTPKAEHGRHSPPPSSPVPRPAPSCCWPRSA